MLELLVDSANRLNDLPASLQPVHAEAWREHLFGAHPAVHALLAFEAATPVGYALWYPTFAATVGRPGIWIDDLFVREPFRRRGHARALLTALRAGTTGRIELVAEENSDATRLYRSLGAEPITRGTRLRWPPLE